jgi:multidrug efflux pump subunit AcrB
MAVVFAMIASYILTYTLVPTMAHFLLKGQHHPHEAGGESNEPRQLGLFGRFQQGFEHYFERLRQGYLGLLGLALHHRWAFAGGFVCFALLSLGLVPGPGLLSFDRLRRDQNPFESANRHADRGNDAVDGRGRAEDSLDHPA